MVAWNRYWRSVQRTGQGGEVLWDSERYDDTDSALQPVLAAFDRSLPVVDLGCGNGRYARALGRHFPRALGIDASSAAVERAEQESRGSANVSFRVVDASVPGAGRRLAEEIGEANVYVRGILHVIDHRSRIAVVENIREIIGDRGALYLVETAFPGSQLDYLEFLTARPGRLPEMVKKLIDAGLPTPESFGEEQYRRYFSADEWVTLDSGPTIIHGVPMRPDQASLSIPSFFAIARRRARTPPAAAAG